MPYKLVIADDEDIIRDGISSFIDWESLGFEIATEFDDGKEVIEYIKTNPVDVVLADIKMNNVSGLELAEYIYKNKPNIKVILISGYQNFDYAKQAIEYNVINYITKPINFQSLSNCFKQLKLTLDKEREKSSRELEQKKRYNEMLPLFQEQLFTDLLHGVLRNPIEITKRIQMLGLDINPADGTCCIIDIDIKNLEAYLLDKWQHGKDGLKNALHNFLQGVTQNMHYFPVLSNQKELTIITIYPNIKDQQQAKESVIKYLNEKKEQINNVIGLEIEFNIRSIWPSIFEMVSTNQSHMQGSSPMVKDTREFIDMGYYKQLMKKQELFVPYINAGDKEAVINLLEGYLSELEGLQLKQVHYFIFDLFAEITTKMKNIGLNLWEISHGDLNQHDFASLKGKDDICEWCKEKLEEITELVIQQRKTSNNWVLQKAEEYIQQNFHRDISLEDVANQVFLSSAYFCHFFKEGKGINFSDYLVKMRVEKALELIENPKNKIQDIAQVVGYSNSKYFTRIFKKYLGCTPSEYQMNILKRGNNVEKK